MFPPTFFIIIASNTSTVKTNVIPHAMDTNINIWKNWKTIEKME